MDRQPVVLTEITRAASPPYGQGRSEDDEGHYPLGVIVITGMIEMKLQLRVQ